MEKTSRLKTESVRKVQERIAFFANGANFAYRRINNLRGIKAGLGNKSTPRNQTFLIVPKRNELLSSGLNNKLLSCLLIAVGTAN